MSDPKKKGKLKKTVRQIEDEFGVDKTVEDVVDSILDIFEDDVDSQEEDDSIFQDDDDDSDDDFGDGDFGGGGADSDW